MKKNIQKRKEKTSYGKTGSKIEKDTSSDQATSTTNNLTEFSHSSTSASTLGNESISSKELHKASLQIDLSMETIFDRARDNVQMTAAQARNEIPRYEEAVRLYQEQTIHNAKAIADNFICTNEEILKSLRSWLLPFWEATPLIWTYVLVSPHTMINIYANIAGTFTGATLRLICRFNDAMLMNLKFLNSTVQHTKENSDDLARARSNLLKKIKADSQELQDVNLEYQCERVD